MPDLRKAYKELDPATPLRAAGLDAYYLPRTDDRIAILAEELKATTQRAHILLAGQRGVGKSTELNRLEVAIGSVRPVVRYSVSDPSRPPTQSALAKYFDDVDIQETLSPSNVILIDGCERLTASHLTRCLKLLANIPAMIIATAPARVALGGDFGGGLLGAWDRAIPVSAVPITEWDGTTRSPNFAARYYLRAIITRRVGEDVFDSDALDQLVEASGGLHRDLLMLSQQACVRAGLADLTKVTRLQTDAVIEERRQELSYSLTPTERHILRQVTEDNAAAVLDTNGVDFLPLLERNIFIAYHTRMTWLAVHPLISAQRAQLAITRQ
jgi:hypothetical protein